MFSLTMIGLSGSVVYMINHGLSTGALFLIVGMIYERYHTREFSKIGGLARRMPWMAFFLIFFTLSSIGLPGLNGFIGEIMVLLGTAASNHDTGGLGLPYAIVAATGIVLGAIYMLYMAGRVLFGPLVEPPDTPDTSNGLSADLTFREIGVLMPLAVACVWIGVYPSHLLNSIQPALEKQIIARVLVEPDRDVTGRPRIRVTDAPNDEMLRFAQHDKDATVALTCHPDRSEGLQAHDEGVVDRKERGGEQGSTGMQLGAVTP